MRVYVCLLLYTNPTHCLLHPSRNGGVHDTDDFGYSSVDDDEELTNPDGSPRYPSNVSEVAKENRAQRFLFTIAFAYFLCLLPLNVLK